MKSNILITGGLGYIGSHTVIDLINNGFNLYVIDDLSNTEISVLDNIIGITGTKPEFHKIDLKNSKKLNTFFKHNKIDGIIHFAAHKAVGESVQFPLKYYHNNLLSLINILENCLKYNIDNIIFSSSCTVYGQAKKQPITELTELKTPESPYGKTKQMGEEILNDFSNSYQKKVITLRYFNPIGAHPSAKNGEIPIGIPNNLIPYLLQTVSGVREYLSVFGNDYPTRDGTPIRDYIDIMDLANAHVLALKRLLNNENISLFETYNLGSGTGSTVLEVIKAFEKHSNEKVNYKIVGRRDGDITEAYADFSKAKNELGWQPKIKLEESLKNAWKWEQNRKKSQI